MTAFSFYIIPVVITLIIIAGIARRVDIFSVFLEGAKNGLEVSIKILPALIGLMTAVGMFKASGALQALTSLLSPIADLVRIPTGVVPLVLLKPISGSGSYAILESIFNDYGPDSITGRVASVLAGSTETTFYTLAVYYGSTKISKTRHTVPCAVFADLVGIVMSALIVRIMFYT